MRSFTVTTEVDIDIFHAWEFYFNQINGWWPKEYFTSNKTKRFIIETYIGGKAYEDHYEGGGLVWGDVIGVDYPNSLQIRGNLTKEFGGPVMTFEKFDFQTVENGTRLKYTVDFVGEISARSANSLKNGWQDLLQIHFKKYCSSR